MFVVGPSKQQNAQYVTLNEKTMHNALSVNLRYETSASDTAVGAILQQYVDGKCHPIPFCRNMKPAKTHYSTFDRELLAVYLAIRHFCHLLEGRHFHVLTNHNP